MRIKQSILIIGMVVLAFSPGLAEDAGKKVPSGVEGEITKAARIWECRYLDHACFIESSGQDIAFTLRYKFGLLFNEPVELFEFKYSLGGGGKIAINTKDQKGFAIVNSGQEAKVAARVNEQGGVTLSVPDELYQFVRFYDTFWFMLFKEGGPNGSTAVIMQNPGVISRANEWGWDVPGSPSWTNLFAIPHFAGDEAAAYSDHLSYYSASAAKDRWKQMCETGPSWWNRLYVHDLALDLTTFFDKCWKVNPQEVGLFLSKLGGFEALTKAQKEAEVLAASSAERQAQEFLHEAGRLMSTAVQDNKRLTEQARNNISHAIKSAENTSAKTKALAKRLETATKAAMSDPPAVAALLKRGKFSIAYDTNKPDGEWSIIYLTREENLHVRRDPSTGDIEFQFSGNCVNEYGTTPRWIKLRSVKKFSSSGCRFRVEFYEQPSMDINFYVFSGAYDSVIKWCKETSSAFQAAIIELHPEVD